MKSKYFSKKIILFTATLVMTGFTAIVGTEEVSAKVSSEELKEIVQLNKSATLALRFECNNENVFIDDLFGNNFYLRKGDVIALGEKLNEKFLNGCHKVSITRISDGESGDIAISSFQWNMTKTSEEVIEVDGVNYRRVSIVELDSYYENHNDLSPVMFLDEGSKAYIRADLRF
ncbi:MAG: hypothetical protein LBF82_01685 [Lactobacillales bacterium]|jgi:hypothetical protein|nr:hypothetical protein [Lactobacillales bacterium]